MKKLKNIVLEIGTNPISTFTNNCLNVGCIESKEQGTQPMCKPLHFAYIVNFKEMNFANNIFEKKKIKLIKHNVEQRNYLVISFFIFNNVVKYIKNLNLN